jgi:F-type H+-transporting ATPase subunit b
MAILYDTYFVVALAFILFFLLLWRYRVQDILFRALDERSERIRRELEDAKRLREEAQTLLASYERKQKEVVGHADAIVARAKEDAEAAAEQAKLDIAASIERRMKAASEQIASAESAAIREVKNQAVSVAIAAAAEVIQSSMNAQAANKRIDDAIAEVGRRLH